MEVLETQGCYKLEKSDDFKHSRNIQEILVSEP